MTRTALETVTIYIDEVWNGGRTELVPELCVDPVTRHDANSVTQLNHAEQRARITHNFAELRPRFENVILAGDNEFITLVWNVTGRDPAWKLCGIEIFRVVGGKIAEVWNSPYVDGRWGLSRALSGSVGGAAPVAFPIMSAEIGAAGGEIVAPVDASNIGRWIERLLGAPVSRAMGDGVFEHRFCGTAVQGLAPLALILTDVDQAPVILPSATVSRILVEVARSGLINATIGVEGEVETGNPLTPQPAAKVTRLAETFGTFERDGQEIGRVVDASISFGVGGAGASGRVSIRMDAGRAPVAGTGRIIVGWRHETFALRFEMEAVLAGPGNSFVDGGEIEASFEWRGNGVVAILDNDLAGGGEG